MRGLRRRAEAMAGIPVRFSARKHDRFANPSAGFAEAAARVARIPFDALTTYGCPTCVETIREGDLLCVCQDSPGGGTAASTRKTNTPGFREIPRNTRRSGRHPSSGMHLGAPPER